MKKEQLKQLIKEVLTEEEIPANTVWLGHTTQWTETQWLMIRALLKDATKVDHIKMGRGVSEEKTYKLKQPLDVDVVIGKMKLPKGTESVIYLIDNAPD